MRPYLLGHTSRSKPTLLSVQPVVDGGGSERALIGMIRQLARAGWECHVAVPGPPVLAEQYRQAGAALHLVEMDRVTSSGHWSRWLRFAGRWPRSVVSLWRLARELDAEVIHSNSLHCWYGWAVAILARRPHVWHAREVVFQSPVALKLERLLARHFARTVIAISDAVATQLDQANVLVVRDEVDPEVFNPKHAGRFRERAGIPDDVALVGSVGRLDTWKGFDTLIEAFSVIRQARPAAELVVAGPTVPGKEGYAAQLETTARSLDGVHWLGPRGDVAELMADCDVFVAVSSEPEPYGLVLVEALACGTPVVAGDAGGPVEILGGDTWSPAGRLVRPSDPAALAAAVVDLLPEAQTSTQSRRQRKALRSGSGVDFEAVFAQVRSRYGRQVRSRRSRK